MNMKLLSAALLASTVALSAQGTQAHKAKSPQAKDSVEAHAARQAFNSMLDSINDAWFGKPYQVYRSVDIQGSLKISVTAGTINQKADSASQGLVKANATSGANVNLTVKSAYFASGDYRTELKGDFGHLIAYRVGTKGFIWSQEQNAYTKRVDPPPTDAPLSFFGWFRQCLNDIKAVYVDGTSFKASLGPDESGFQTLRFTSPTGPYDPAKREQNMDESLGFWKRGKVEVSYSKDTRLPRHMIYTNEGQGVSARMDFTYNGTKVQTITLHNDSKGMEGPANVSITYGADGLMNHVSGTLNFPKGTTTFDLGLLWVKDRKPSDIVTIVPPTANPKGREELETALMVNLATKVLDLQKAGFNLRSVSLGK
jgi:hypothetical protein